MVSFAQRLGWRCKRYGRGARDVRRRGGVDRLDAAIDFRNHIARERPDMCIDPYHSKNVSGRPWV